MTAARRTFSAGDRMMKFAGGMCSGSSASVTHFCGARCPCQPVSVTASSVILPPESTVMLDASQ